MNGIKLAIAAAVALGRLAVTAGEIYWFRGLEYPDSLGAFTDKAHWSDASGTEIGESGPLDPTADYINIGYMRTDATATFAGNSLTIGEVGGTLGQLRVYGQSDLRFSNGDGLILAKGLINNSHSAGVVEDFHGKVTVTAPASLPFGLYTPQPNQGYRFKDGPLAGAAGTGLVIGYGRHSERDEPMWSKTGSFIQLQNDCSAFYGVIIVTSVCDNAAYPFTTGSIFKFGNLSMPGKVSIRKNGVLQADADDSVLSVGGLRLDAGSALRIKYSTGNNSISRVEIGENGTLELEPGINVAVEYKPIKSTTGEEIFTPLIVGPKGVRIDSTCFVFHRDPQYEPKDAGNIYPQRIHFEAKTDPATDRDTLYAVIEPIIVQTVADGNWVENTFKNKGGSGFFKADSWSDGRPVHEKAHYYTRTILGTPNTAEDWTFPGYSLISYGGSFACFAKSSHKFSIPLYETCEGIRVGENSQAVFCGGVFRTCGSLVKIVGCEIAPFEMASEIVGSAEIQLRTSDSTTYHRNSQFTLSGLNTNFFGTITLTQTLPTAAWVRYFPTLFLLDGRNLGGRLDGFNPQALKLQRLAELAVTNGTVTLDVAMNRGILIDNLGARIRVSEGATLKCGWPITLNATLWKDGAGTLELGGGAPLVSSAQSLVVTNGTIKAMCHDCVNGLTLDLAQDSETASLAVDFNPQDADLARYGFYNVATDAPFALNGKVTIRLDNVDNAELERQALTDAGYRQGLVTVKTAAADDLEENLVFEHPRYVKLIREDDAQTGLTTFFAGRRKTGLLILLK